MKKVLSLLLTVLMLIPMIASTGISVNAEVIKSGSIGSVYWALEDNGVLTISGSGSMGTYTSSSSYPWYSYRSSITTVNIVEGVTSIGEDAFYSYSELTEVYIPNSITTIKGYAFYNCKGLTEVYIPNSVTSVLSTAFNGCENLTIVCNPGSYAETFASNNSVKFRYTDSNTIYLKAGTLSTGHSWTLNAAGVLKISGTGNTTNYSTSTSMPWNSYKDRIVKVVFSNNCTSIGNYFLYGCTALEEVVLPTSLTTIGNYAFRGCSELDSLTLPDSVTSIGTYAFAECKAFTSFTLPAGMSEISNYCFDACSSLAEVYMQEGIESIGEYAFSDCIALDNIVVPDTVTTIKRYAFDKCTSLSEITLSASLKTIDSYAFNNCTALKSIFIPDLVSTISSTAFNGITPEISCNRGTAAELCLIKSAYTFKYADSDRVYIQSGTVNSNINWQLTDDGILEINGTGAMSSYSSYSNVPWYSYRSSIKRVEISDGITSIGSYAFYGASSLSEIVIPDSVTTIGNYAFYNCKSLVNTDLPDSVITIGQYVFYGCNALVNIDLSDTLTTIGNYAFFECTALKGIVLPESVNSIGSNVFSGCTALAFVEMSDNITSIGVKAFYNCSALESIILPDGITSVEASTFYGCSSLSEIILPAGLVSIMSSAFYNCSSLGEVYIPESVTIIESSVFKGASNLTILCTRGTYAARYAINNSLTFRYTDSDRVYIKTGFMGSSITYLISEDGVLEIVGSGNMNNYSSASSVPWYSNRSSITSVEISDGITSISSYAFYGFSSLESIDIPDTVGTIGANAFNSCTSLAEITIPDSVKTLGNYTFSKCTSLSKVKIGSSVTTLPAYLFNGCSALSEIEILKNVTSVASTAFTDCSDFKIICDKESFIEDYAYTNNIAWIYTDGSRHVFGADDYDGKAIWCHTSDKKLYIYSDAAMENYTDGKAPWYDNRHRIDEIFIHSDVTRIGVFAFNETSAKRVNIPSGIKSIGNYAFSGCTSLKEVYASDLNSWLECDFAGSTSNPLCYGAQLYFGNKPVTDINIPEGTEEIGDYKFCSYTGISSLTLPSTLKYIGTNAFYRSGTNMSVNVKDLDTWLDIEFEDIYSNPLNTPYAKLCFNGYAIENITVNREAVGNYAFAGYGKLKSVVLTDSVKGIGENAFTDCTSLETVTMGYSVEYIADNAFEGRSADLVINVYDSSYALEYAEAKGIKYNIITCDHSFTDYISDANGSCTENGTMTAYCDLGCGYADTIEEPDSIRHSYVLNVLLAPTCMKTGVGLNLCQCGDRKNITLEKTEHSYTDYVSNNDGTCLSEGTKTAYCDYGCGNTSTVNDNGTFAPHKYTKYSYLNNATCIADGTEIAYCDYGCGSNVTRVAEGTMISHSFTDYRSNNDGDCYNDGTMTAYCDYGCNASDTVTEPDSRIHNYEFYTVILEPTCLIEGKAEYTCQCSDSKSVVLDRVGHRYGEFVYNNDSTCYSDGTMTAYCIFGCGSGMTAAAEGTVSDHIFEEYKYNGDATCTADGTETAYCIFGCQESDTRIAVDSKTDHEYETEIIQEADCANEGVVLYICKCNEFYYDILPTVPHTWGGWIITTAPTAETTGISTRVCDVCSLAQTKELPAKEMILPEISIHNYILSITNAEYIKDIRYAKGNFTTPGSIKAAEGNVALSNAVIKNNTVNGMFVYEMPDGGLYSAWIRMTDGGEYIHCIDMTKFTPMVTTYGVKITVDGLYDVKDFFIAKGQFNSYNEIKNNGYIVRVTENKIAGKHNYTYTVSDPGMHTVLVRYNNGTEHIFHEDLTVDEPVFTTNGLQVTVSNIPDVKVIRTAYGEYYTPGDTKRAEGARNFSNKSVIKDAEEYMLQYREEGRVTIIVEYNNGYVKVFHYDVTKKTPTVEQNENSVTFGNLDGLVMIRYAEGEYATSSEIKKAPGSKVIKPDAIVDGNITATLEPGTYTFSVQFDDDSYNYYTVTVE